MTSRLKDLTATYYQLSSLYKNPTRHLRGAASSDLDAELAAWHAKLLDLFAAHKWGAEKPAHYYKILALLYEVDDYRGRITPSVERAIFDAPTATVEHFNTRRADAAWRGADFGGREARTLWKAKVLCCVASVESRRKSSDSDALLRELNVLERFVTEKLHLPTLPAWTTLAFVRTAQARVARQEEEYTYVRDKLLSVVECLDERAAEIIEKFSAGDKKLFGLRQGRKTKRAAAEIEGLEEELEGLVDDLVLIRQKHALTALFNYGLDNLQRGFLDAANHACQAARFLFRLHGHAHHRLFNELLMISVKRARTSRKNRSAFLALERDLVRHVRSLEEKGAAGNPKLYVYALRELAVVQHRCEKLAEMTSTLRKMGRITPLGPQWKSRISLLHSRASYGAWEQAAGGIKDRRPDLLLAALDHCETAFRHAVGAQDGGIASHEDAHGLLAFVRNLGNRNLIDTTESLITYGTVQLLLKTWSDAVKDRAGSIAAIREALKSAEAVVELSGADNPRLLAMGHLVAADAYRERGSIVEARHKLEKAKALEARIQHEYVKDRREAVERKITTTLTLYRNECGHIDQAGQILFGWYIENCADKSSIFRIAKQLEVGPRRVREFIEGQGPAGPYHHLLKRDRAKKKRARAK